MSTQTISQPKSTTLLSPGHRACAGCGQLIAARTVAEALGPNTIIANATGCLEVTTTPYPESVWGMPWIHSLFENASAVASGIKAALDYQEKNQKSKIKNQKSAKVVAQGGDGGTFDIGFGLISGMWERGENILYVCYDNEAYMNCLSTSSLIMAKNGLKKITEIKKNDELYAFDQKTNKLILKKCSGVFNNGIKKIYKLETLHHSIKATANHPFLTVKKNGRGKSNQLSWKTLAEIKTGDEIIILKKLNNVKSYRFKPIHLSRKGDFKVNKLNAIKLPQYSNADVMKYLGIYLGDGWIRIKRGEIGFALPKGTKGRSELMRLHLKIFGGVLKTDDMYIYAHSVNIARFIDSLNFGSGAKNKIIPDWIFTLPDIEKETFLEGLMLSDGYKNGNSWRYVSASEELLKRLRLLLQTMNWRVGKIHSQIKKKGAICVKRILLRDSTYGYICFSRKKSWNIDKYPNQYKYQNFLINNENFETVKVKSVKFVMYEPTLDLRVEDEHNFIADGIVVHNTGVQASGATPFDAHTTTTPAGKHSFGSRQRKKDMVAIALAHSLPYVAQTTAGFLSDITAKVKKAMATEGPSYIQILSPCVPGWGVGPAETIKLGKLAAQTGLYPLLEYVNGELVNAMKVPNPRPKVDEYLKSQVRFKHLFKTKEGKKELEYIQRLADKNVKKYGLK